MHTMPVSVFTLTIMATTITMTSTSCQGCYHDYSITWFLPATITCDLHPQISYLDETKQVAGHYTIVE